MAEAPVRTARSGSKAMTPTQVVESLSTVGTMALGGLALENRPCTLVRAVVRAGVRATVLTSSPVGSWDADIMLLAGLVDRVRIPHISLGDAGLAPGVRTASADGRVLFEDLDEGVLVGGLLAAAEGSPYQVLHHVGTNDVLDNSPLVERRGDQVVVPALHPDVVLLHAPLGDAAGNLAHLDSRFADLLLARAGRRVYAQVDAIVPTSVVRRIGITVPGHLVDGVVAARYAAHPTGSGGCYAADLQHLTEYARNVADGGAHAYLTRYCDPDLAGYLELIGTARMRALEAEALR